MNTTARPQNLGPVYGAFAPDDSSQPWNVRPGSNPPWPAPVRKPDVVLRGKYCSIRLEGAALAPVKFGAHFARAGI